MKILKKLLIVGFFSLFILPNVFAISYVSSTTNNNIDLYLQNHSNNDVNDFKDMILNDFEFPDNEYVDDNYIIFTNPLNYNSRNLRLYYLSSSYYQNIAYNYNYGSPAVYFRNAGTGENFNYCYRDYYLNSSGEVSSKDSWICFATNTFAGLNPDTYIFSTNYPYFEYTSPSWDTSSFSVNEITTYNWHDNIPVNFKNGGIYNIDVTDYFGDNEPTYNATQTLLDNGNVKLNFTFENYVEGYGFTIENGISNEEYGIVNPYDSIYPNIIPFGNEYSIELSYDTYIYVTLAQYTQISGTNLYDKEVLYTDVIDINNVVFENINDPYFSIVWQNKNYLIGKYKNTQSNYTCWYRYSTDNIDTQVNCNENLDINYNINGYIKVYIKKGNNIIYERNINLLGGNITEKPYIVYEIQKQDFYSIVKWNVENENYDINLTYRYSTDGGNNFTSWTLSDGTEKQILVFDNTNVIIEIANRLQNEIYDSKSITVINDINNIKSTNNTTNNIINKFKNIFNVNGKILQNVNTYWNSIKLTNLYLLIFIPFITSIICCIIYLIRRK